jgi:hypothetical protein
LKGGSGFDSGIVPRAIEDVLSMTKYNDFNATGGSKFGSTPQFKIREQQVFLKMSIYMIYNDQITDLLSKEKKYSTNYGDQNNHPNPEIIHYMDNNL